MSVDDRLEPPDAATRIAEIAEHAAAELPGADYANVTVISEHSDIGTPVATHPWAERIDERTRQLGSLFAAHVTLVSDAARRESQFQAALASRNIIGQAKGMFMERYTMDAKIVDAAQANLR